MSTRGVVVQELQRGTAAVVPVGGALTFGRNSKMSDVLCKDPHVSRRHCAMRGEPDGRVRIKDLGSSSGTYVNGRRVTGEVLVGPGCPISLGRDYKLEVVGLVGPFAAGGIAGEPRLPYWLTPTYLLLREVGRGGMGMVFEAYDVVQGERCAVKWLAPGGKVSEEIEERFRREANLQAALSDYPGIVTLKDLGITQGTGELFCVMEFVEGQNLHRKLKTGLSRLEGVKIVARVARAVDYAHERGIVHRDLKPANVMLTGEGTVRLTDFGIAKAFVDDDSGGLTATGIMMGTPGYMAPEQIVDCATAGVPSDIYGLGAILYHVLVGRPPVKGKLLREVLECVEKGTFDSPSKLDPTVDAQIEMICLKALERKPKNRWQSAHELAQALEDWLREQDPVKKVKLRPPGA
jgi:serine/threonine protein kinase